MKIALCLHGLVGSIKGKSYQLAGGSYDVLYKAYEHNKNFILSTPVSDIDIFVHSWSTECKDAIIDLYQPKKFIIEPQINFKIPSYIIADHSRAFAHLSRWYSFKQVNQLKSEHEIETSSTYDLVLNQRFDLCWNIAVDFESIDTSKLIVGSSRLDTSKYWQDQWFIANSNNLDKLSTLYDMIPKYMDAGGPLTSKQQYAGISSHQLIRHHALTIGLTPVFKYSFGYQGEKNDYTEVRRQYYGDNL